jgi:hypothetical protein
MSQRTHPRFCVFRTVRTTLFELEHVTRCEVEQCRRDGIARDSEPVHEGDASGSGFSQTPRGLS